MVFLSGTKTTGDTPTSSVATVFRALEDVTITSLRTKISSTGNAASIDLIVHSSVVRTVVFSNVDANFITTSQGVFLPAGTGIFFARDNNTNDFNATAQFELTYEPVIVAPPLGNNYTQTYGTISNDGFELTVPVNITKINPITADVVGILQLRSAVTGGTISLTELPILTSLENLQLVHRVSILFDFAVVVEHFIRTEAGIAVAPNISTVVQPTITPPPPPDPDPVDPNIATVDLLIAAIAAGDVWTLIEPAASSIQTNTISYNAGNITATEWLNAWDNFTNLGLIEPFSTPPTPDPVPNATMVSQSLGVFDLAEDRLTGEILYIANSSFDPFFYGKTVFSFLSIKDPSGADLVTKQNDLVFTELERDERLFFDESAFGNAELHLKAFVFSLDSEFNSLAFSDVKEFIVNAADPPVVPPTTPTGGGKISQFLLAAPIIGIAALFLNSARKMKR